MISKAAKNFLFGSGFARLGVGCSVLGRTESVLGVGSSVRVSASLGVSAWGAVFASLVFGRTGVSTGSVSVKFNVVLLSVLCKLPNPRPLP